MVELVGEFYKQVSQIEARQLSRGQICWAPVGYLSSHLQSVSLTSYHPRDESLNVYAMSIHAPDDSSPFDHPPVHELRLQNDEALLVNRVKRRPAVVMSQKNDFWSLGVGRLTERGLVCLPMYSFHADDSEEFRRRIRAQEYPWWIYFPAQPQLRLQEGFARLDRVQTIEETHLQPTLQALTDDALWFVSEWLRYYLTEEIDDVLFQYRQESMRGLP